MTKLRCKVGDVVMVVKSEIGNEGRIGCVVARAVLGDCRFPGVEIYDGDDWIVEGRFMTADEHVLSIGGIDCCRWDSNTHEELLLAFPDTWLRPFDPDSLLEPLSIADEVTA